MSLQDIPLFAALTERMKWLSTRQKVLSQNISNSDTPGYRAQDLKPQKFKDMVARPSESTMNLSKTQGNHIQVEAKQDFKSQTVKNTYEVTPTGNAVVLEEQMMQLADTQIQYQLTTSLYKKHLSMLKAALGRQ